MDGRPVGWLDGGTRMVWLVLDDWIVGSFSGCLIERLAGWIMTYFRLHGYSWLIEYTDGWLTSMINTWMLFLVYFA